MQKVLLLRYGEIFLKGKNKAFFENKLIENIKKALDGLDYKFIKTQNRYYVEDYDEWLQDELVDRLRKVFGLTSLSVAIKVKSQYELMGQAVQEYVPQGKNTFRVTVNRADKRLDKNSMQIAAMMGGYCLDKNPMLKVDLHSPQVEIFVDIRERGYAYVFSGKIPCAGGMPVGTAGKGMLLLSGGFDSPVAGWRMARRGMEIYAIHYHSYPHTSELAKQKVIDLAQKLTDYCGNIKLFVVQFTDIQQKIHQYCRADYMITVMRRIMIDIAERTAVKYGCGALITGESLAQVASQTTESITVTNNAVKLLPVFRPLIGMDKNEIMDTAKAIDTYATSELPYEDCCTVFLPKYPVIKPSIQVAVKEQSRIENLEESILKAIEDTEILDLGVER
ncbi:MAG: tRNA 4-thiouridine(8) synthase ThiI [Clostridia bacterium]|nr:tRNA 4-thiouridine(8) synthase ThiI [Clostridia bacterium]MDY4083704.1 tRNA uracil 4-sulfurtransferase ThiI [Eubacteriales bacterium]